MINTATVGGNLTRDAELRVTSGGMAILKGCIAVNERVKEGDEWTDRPTFIDWTLFGSRAEKLASAMAKGAKVVLSGRLHEERWQAKDGGNRSKLTLIVNDLELPSRREAAQPEQPTPYASDEIPF